MLLSFFRRLERPFRTMRPGRLIVLVFLFIILLGAGLLCLPAASRSGEAVFDKLIHRNLRDLRHRPYPC